MMDLVEHNKKMAAKYGLEEQRMTRIVTDPAEMEAIRIKTEGQRLLNHFLRTIDPLPMPIRLSIRARAKMNGAPRAHHAVEVGEVYPKWLQDRAG